MPVKIKPSESKEEFISRCIGIEKSYGKDNDVAAAICYTYWENRNMSSQQRVLDKINKFIEPNPCQSGYIAIGTKVKDGRTVPNCVPEE